MLAHRSSKIRHGVVEAKSLGRQGGPARRIAGKYATPIMAIITHHGCSNLPVRLPEAVSEWAWHRAGDDMLGSSAATPARGARSSTICGGGGGGGLIQGRRLEAAVNEVIARNVDGSAPPRPPAETGASVSCRYWCSRRQLSIARRDACTWCGKFGRESATVRSAR